MISAYKLARKILPVSLQARLGNRHKVKRQTLDALLFRFTKHPGEQPLFYQKSLTQVPAETLERNLCIPAPVLAAYQQWYRTPQVQQVTHVTGDVWIAPRGGWPMGRGNALYLSLHPSGITPYKPVPDYRTIVHKNPCRSFEKIISLRDVNEEGYSHFYSDVLARLALIQLHCPAHFNLKDYTLIISRKVAETAYGRHLITHSPLFNHFGNIFYQDNEFIHSREAIFAHACVNPTANMDMFKNVIAAAKASSPVADVPRNRKLFLTRANTRRRHIRNSTEIEAIARAKGFEVVDADALSLPQQIQLFSECRHLIGIHGAGLVNMLYRYPHPLSLFEICEPVRPLLGLNAQYHNTAAALNAGYGATLGEDSDAATQSFYVPPERFEHEFNRFWDLYGDNPALDKHNTGT